MYCFGVSPVDFDQATLGWVDHTTVDNEIQYWLYLWTISFLGASYWKIQP